jgi:hypothetical protein
MRDMYLGRRSDLEAEVFVPLDLPTMALAPPALPAPERVPVSADADIPEKPPSGVAGPPPPQPAAAIAIAVDATSLKLPSHVAAAAAGAAADGAPMTAEAPIVEAAGAAESPVPAPSADVAPGQRGGGPRLLSPACTRSMRPWVLSLSARRARRRSQEPQQCGESRAARDVHDACEPPAVASLRSRSATVVETPLRKKTNIRSQYRNEQGTIGS